MLYTVVQKSTGDVRMTDFYMQVRNFIDNDDFIVIDNADNCILSKASDIGYVTESSISPLEDTPFVV